MRQQLFTNHDKYHLHKVLGFGCLFNFFLRIYWLIVYGSMYIYTDSQISVLIPVAHLTLSLSYISRTTNKVKLKNYNMERITIT